MTGEHVLEWLAGNGLANWSPPGRFDQETGVWFTDEEVDNTFPAEGIERFGRVDGTSFWFHHRNNVILDRLTRLTAQPRLFVDVGAGSGVVARHLSAAGLPVATIEPHPAGAVVAAQRGIVASFCGDLASLQLPDSSIAALGAFDVIEHIEEPGALLAEVRRVLRPDGHFLITVPAYRWLWSAHDDWNGHFERYTTRRLAAVLADASLTLTEHSYLFSPLVAPAYLVRVLGRRFQKERSADEMAGYVEGALDPSLPLVDRTIRTLLAFERRIMRRRRIPFGTSLLGVARPS